MMRGGFEYAMIGIVTLLAFFCFLIGSDKMIKLILGSTILMIIIFGWSALLQTWIFYLTKLGTARTLLGIAQPTLLTIVQSIDTTTSIIIFVGLMIVMMTYTHLDIVFDSMRISSQGQQLLLVPAAIVSLVIGLAVAVLGVDILNPAKLQLIAQMLTTNPQVQIMVTYLPLGVLLQGCISLGLVSSLGLAFGRSEE